MISADDVIANLNIVMADLLAKTSASRTTLHLNLVEYGLKFNGVVAEALPPGIKSIAAETSLLQLKTETAVYLRKHQKILVQNDCLNADLQPPDELVQTHGAKAQMLAPIEREDKLVGWISVHYNLSSRQWTPEDVAALKEALAATHKEMDDILAREPDVFSEVQSDSQGPEAPIDSARLQATEQVPEPDSLGG